MATKFRTFGGDGKSAHLYTPGPKHFCERFAWIADVASMISRPNQQGWQRGEDEAYRREARAHDCHGLRWASDLLRAQLARTSQAGSSGQMRGRRGSRNKVDKWPALAVIQRRAFSSERLSFAMRGRASSRRRFAQDFLFTTE